MNRAVFKRRQEGQLISIRAELERKASVQFYKSKLKTLQNEFLLASINKAINEFDFKNVSKTKRMQKAEENLKEYPNSAGYNDVRGQIGGRLKKAIQEKEAGDCIRIDYKDFLDLANGVIQSFSNERSQENEQSIQNLVEAFTKLDQQKLHQTFSEALGALYEGRKRPETGQSLGAALRVVQANKGKSLLNKLQGQVKKNPKRFKNAMKKMQFKCSGGITPMNKQQKQLFIKTLNTISKGAVRKQPSQKGSRGRFSRRHS